MQHKAMTIILLCVFGSAYLWRSDSGTTYYVSPQGNDQNPGTSSRPWASIQKAADSVRAGDTVIVRAGRYYERIVMKTSGTASAPITFRGERSPEGEYLTIINGSDATAGWVEDVTKGYGVYKTDDIPYASYAMISDDKDIPRLGWKPGTTYDGFKFIGLDPDATCVTLYEGATVKYFDGIDALYYPVHDAFGGRYTTYIRFRNGGNPAGKNVRSSPDGACFTIDNKSYILISDFKLLGARYGVLLENRAYYNVIEKNVMTTGQTHVYITDGSSYNLIRDNEMFMDGLTDFHPGGWNCIDHIADPAERYQHAVKEHIYNVYKAEVGNGATSSLDDDSGIIIRKPGAGNEIYRNKIHDTLGGIAVFDAPSGIKIYENAIYNTSSIGIGLGSNQYNVEVFDNLLYDSNGSLRFQDMEVPGRRIYVYRNRIVNGAGHGDNLYFHYGKTPQGSSDRSEIWIYQNTFSGGCWGFSISSLADNFGGAPNVYFLNNIFSTTPGSRIMSGNVGRLGGFDYNWLGSPPPRAIPRWFGHHNIIAPGQQIWPDEAIPRFRLPDGSRAIAAGIDLSHPFTIGRVTYQPLPGMASGYFPGPRPDLGAVQTQEPRAEP